MATREEHLIGLTSQPGVDPRPQRLANRLARIVGLERAAEPRDGAAFAAVPVTVEGGQRSTSNGPANECEDAEPEGGGPEGWPRWAQPQGYTIEDQAAGVNSQTVTCADPARRAVGAGARAGGAQGPATPREPSQPSVSRSRSSSFGILPRNHSSTIATTSSPCGPQFRPTRTDHESPRNTFSTRAPDADARRGPALVISIQETVGTSCPFDRQSARNT